MFRKILEEHKVSSTALLANYWKNSARKKQHWGALCIQEGNRQQDLFKDTLMESFIDADVTAQAETLLNKRMWLPLATRTRFFRRTISHHIKINGVQQVISLGSGFDTLSVRKRKYSDQFGVSFFEIDQAFLLGCKESLYRHQQISKNAVYIGMDYVKENLIEKLQQCNNLDVNKPTLILWEGNTFYLEKDDAIRILRELSSHFKKLIICFDYMHTSMNTDTQQIDQASHEKSLQNTLQQFRKHQSPFKTFFTPDEIVSLCESLGISCIAHKTAAELAKEYEVDQDPYYTAKTYSVITAARI